ncbi:MAG TPA: two-component regulator propeller domain-containing protein [Rudaea sp.]|nr:two-component regulator propeller domain-containing protein [Rudaea sp.]
MLAGIAAVGCAHAQSNGDVPGVETVRFRSYGNEQGLSQPTALAMTQDSAGFLWIGTQDGLNRFDGYSFKVYKHDRADAWSLADNHVYALAPDRDGSLWIGTQTGGLDRYDPALDRFERYAADPARSDALGSDYVTALLVDRSGRLWVATTAARLQWLDRATNRFRETPLGARQEFAEVRALAEEADGSVLIGARKGLWRCDPDATQMRELRYDSAHALDVQAIALAKNGDLWVSSTDAGLFHFGADGSPLAHYGREADAAHALPDNEVRGLGFDELGRLWIATKNSGLLRLDPDRGSLGVYRHDAAEPQSVANNRQQTVFVDRDGVIWAGSWNNGISMHDPRTEAFARLKSVRGDAHTLPSRSVSTVLANPDGTMWVAVSEGAELVKFDPRSGVVARLVHEAAVPDSAPARLVEDMKRTRDGSVWFATAGDGLARLPADSSRFIHFHHADADPGSIASDDLLYLFEDRAGTLWVGTADSGLDELCEGCTRFRHHRHDPSRLDSIGSGPVDSMLEAADGTFWVALRPGGLEHYDPAQDRFEHITARLDDPASLSNNTVTMLMQDSHGGIWVGTQGGGLDRMIPGTEASPRFDVIDSSSGLPSDAIGSIVEDASGKLWLSTTVGISRLDPATRHVINFGGREGALAAGYFINAWTRLNDGRIVFAGPTGATVFDPAAVSLPPAPRPIITDVLLNNRPIQLRWRDAKSPVQSSPWLARDRVVFDYRQDYVSFEFSAFGFGDPESVEYSYLLEGHDANWIGASTKVRYATYTDLPRGDYRLRVRARRDGDAWNPHEAVLDVRVLPPPWTSPLAYFAYALVLLTIAAAAGWRVRVNWRREALAKEAIRASEERLKFALWGSGGELWDVDLRTGTMFRENRLEQLRASHETRAQTLAEYHPYVHPDDLPEFERCVAEHVKGKTAFLEVSYRTPGVDGEWHWLLSRGRVAERAPNGRALRITGTTQDITTLKRAEESLRKLNEELELRVDMRTADLRKANAELRHTLEQLTLAQRQLLESEKMAALGGLVAGVAHEINTPLGVTVTAASHLQEETTRITRLLADGRLSQDDLADFQGTASDSAEIILRNLHRADRLIKSFKLIAVDQTTEERRDIELGAYLNDIMTSLGPALKKTPHKVFIDCPAAVHLDTYPGALYQIVSNLVMNSLMHAFEPGVAGEIRVFAERHGDHVRLTYRDNGKGMSESVCAQIFEPFFTTRRGQGGSGLGMHIVYNLVTQLLKGSIRVESAPGEGARFEILLPIEAVEASAA